MTARLLRPRLALVAALSLAAAAFLAQSVALPARVLACSCAAPPSLAEVAATDNVAVVIGTVGRALPDRTPVGVDTWFHGANPTELVWLNTGSEMVSSCDIFMTAGERRFFVLYPGEAGLYSAGLCAPNAVLDSPQGSALVDEAIATFGDGQPPPAPTPEPPSAPGPPPWLGQGLIWVSVAVGAAALLFAAIVVAGTRTKRR